jgi:hypothetical protein
MKARMPMALMERNLKVENVGLVVTVVAIAGEEHDGIIIDFIDQAMFADNATGPHLRLCIPDQRFWLTNSSPRIMNAFQHQPFHANINFGIGAAQSRQIFLEVITYH